MNIFNNNGFGIIITLSIFDGGTSADFSSRGDYRQPRYAGSFYPANKESIKKMLDHYFNRVKLGINAVPKAIIVPHAGYIYSGETAAYAYSSLMGKPVSRIILLATSHYAYLNGVVINEKPYQTPSGVYFTDKTAIDALKKEIFPIVVNETASTREHSDEVQIPFLLKAAPSARLVPIIVGDMSAKDMEKTAAAISKISDDKTVIIASSDFTHYGSSFGYTPDFGSLNKREGIRAIDLKAVDYITRLDSAGFLNYVKESGATICGANPIALMLKILNACKFTNNGVLLKYTTSGELTGDFDQSVSYAAILFGDIKQISEKSIPKPVIDNKLINEDEEKTLLKLSRYVMTEFIGNSISKFTINDLKSFKISDNLKQNLGVFVTIKKNDELRGCIGFIEGMGPLFQSVISNTINSCSKDPRFSSVTKDELDSIKIEISIMTPLVKIKSLDEIKIGRDGLFLLNGYHSGVFLPQVPLEWGWDLKTYLEELCGKAGLSPDKYLDKNTEIFRFSAQVFGEDEEFM